MKRTLLWLTILCCSCKDDILPETASPDVSPIFPKGSTVIGTGPFTSYAHGLSGVASFYSTSAGMKAFALQHFSMTAGPDVHVYISKSSNYGKGSVIELGKLDRDYRMDSLSFDFSTKTYDPSYRFVLVYCVEFNSLFGYSELK